MKSGAPSSQRLPVERQIYGTQKLLRGRARRPLPRPNDVPRLDAMSGLRRLQSKVAPGIAWRTGDRRPPSAMVARPVRVERGAKRDKQPLKLKQLKSRSTERARRRLPRAAQRQHEHMIRLNNRPVRVLKARLWRQTMFTLGLTRHVAIPACTALALLATVACQNALAQSGLPIRNFRVDVSPLRVNAGDPTASWVQQGLPGQLAKPWRAT